VSSLISSGRGFALATFWTSVCFPGKPSPQDFAHPEVRESWIRDKHMQFQSFFDPQHPAREVDVFVALQRLQDRGLGRDLKESRHPVEGWRLSSYPVLAARRTVVALHVVEVQERRHRVAGGRVGQLWDSPGHWLGSIGR
jgi:hypothetical protein